MTTVLVTEYRYIEPPTKRVPKYIPPTPPKKDKEGCWIRLILGLCTIYVLWLIFKILGTAERKL